MADSTIPSSTDTLPATDIIPGSEVQKTTALGQGTLPEPPQIGLDKQSQIVNVLRVLGAGLQGVYAPPGSAAKFAGFKEAENVYAFNQEIQKRQALGYISKLNAVALGDPTMASQALQKLGGFLGENAANLPVEVQVVGEQALKNLKGLATQQAMRDVFKSFAAQPTMDPRQRDALELGQMLMKSDVDPATAFGIGAKWAALRPEAASNVDYKYDAATRMLIAVPRNLDPARPIQDQIKAIQVNPDGSGEGFSMPITPSEIYSQAKNYDRAAASLGLNTTAGVMANALTMLKPGAQAIHAQILDKAHQMDLADKERERALGARQKLTADQIVAAQSPEFKRQFPGVSKPEYLEDLDRYPGALKQLQDLVEERALQKKTIQGIATEIATKPDVAVYDPKTKQQITGDPVVLAQGIKDGSLVNVGKDNAAKLNSVIAPVRREFQMAAYLMGQVRLANGNNGAMNLGKAIDLWAQRKSGTGQAAESQLLKGIFNTISMQMVKFYTNNGRAPYAMVQDFKESVPYSDVLSVEAGEKMIGWHLNQINAQEQLLLKQNPPPLDPQEFWQMVGAGAKTGARVPPEKGTLGGRPIVWDK